jgi:hypothetical protein
VFVQEATKRVCWYLEQVRGARLISVAPPESFFNKSFFDLIKAGI